MIYYNNKSASAKLQTGGQTPKEFQTEYIQSSKYAARLKSSGYQAIPKVVEKDLSRTNGLNKYKHWVRP
jgi:3-methyladenine DNA glycosylase Tag